MNKNNRNRLRELALLVISAGVLVGTPFVGMRWVSPRAIFCLEPKDADLMVFWSLRVPRSCLAYLAGSALAVSGMAFQAMFRNPLADPFTLGVSSGAALGAGIYVSAGLSFSLFGVPGICLFGFLGALLALVVVHGLTFARGSFSATTLLLAGVAASFFFSSFLLLLQYMSDFTQSFRMIRWLMG